MVKAVKAFIIALALTWIAACMTGRDAAYTAKAYVGKSTDEFFVHHGPPYATYRLTNGDILYSWSSGSVAVQTPAVTTESGQVGPGGSYYGTSVTTGGGTFSMQCDVRLLAGPDHVIKQVTITHDSIGAWAFSRCAEVLN